MSDKVWIGQNAMSLEMSPAFEVFTGVRLWYDDEQYFFAGDETGRVLEADNPWATQEMADHMLASIAGFAYQPYAAAGAVLDPAAELGDAVTVGGVYGQLAAIDTRFDALMVSDILAPGEKEVDHEYPYLSRAEREYKRNKARTYSLISKTSEEIRLEVYKLQTNTELSLEELEKSFGADLEDLAGNITETLEQYSTITQTAEKIALAVSTSKEYTNTKTGEITKSLASYSTIEQTSKSIELAVTGLINEEHANSLISQAMDKIELSVSSSEGSTSLKLTSNGVEIDSDTVELSVNAMKINGLIQASQLNLSGAITWDDLAPETQDEIEAQHTSLPSYIKRTYIDATTVKSPTIEGNDVIARTAFKVTPVGTDGDGDEVEVPCGSMGLAFGETLDENGDPVTTYGVALASASTSIDANGAITVASNGYYVIVTNEGVRLQAGDTRLYVTDNGAFYNGVELGVGTGGVAVFG